MLTPWMEFAVNFLQVSFIHMGVDLRCADISMSEHFLNNAQIGSAAEQMRCETVPQLVRMHGLFETCTFSAFAHDLPDA